LGRRGGLSSPGGGQRRPLPFRDGRRAGAEIDPGTKIGAHRGVIAEFIAAVQNGTVPETAAADNIKSLAMVFGAIESAETGRHVSISI
jgi:predicted dehydrogenase